MHHTQILQALIDTFGYQSFLEIGVDNGLNFVKLEVPHKVGVDPAKKSRRWATHSMRSDDYFQENPHQTFDLIFIDGLHEADQVLRDVDNGLSVLNDGGTIVCHDLNPRSFHHQVVPRVKPSGKWLGDCWKAWVSLRRRANLSLFVVDSDFGCGIIRRRHPSCSLGPHPLPLTGLPLTLDYKALAAHRAAWLNLISVETFQKWLGDMGKTSLGRRVQTMRKAVIKGGRRK